jgi:hypothetical protein
MLQKEMILALKRNESGARNTCRYIIERFLEEIRLFLDS